MNSYTPAPTTAPIQPRRRVAEGSSGSSTRVATTLRLRTFPVDEASASQSLIEARALFKSYKRGKNIVPVLKGVDFAAENGKITAIVGQSGSGKSTLLHLLGTLDKPDEGEVFFDDGRIDNLPRRNRDQFRNRELGMIFQFYHLLPELSMLENIIAPCMIGSSIMQYFWSRRTIANRAKELLDLVGLSHRMYHRPRELSGGEMQRTAIARALITEPRLLLADEPTGNLDQETGQGILEILQRLNKERQLTIVLVTHDEAIAKQSHCIVRLIQGRVEKIK